MKIIVHNFAASISLRSVIFDKVEEQKYMQDNKTKQIIN